MIDPPRVTWIDLAMGVVCVVSLVAAWVCLSEVVR